MKTQNNKNEPKNEKSLGSTPCSPSQLIDSIEYKIQSAKDLKTKYAKLNWTDNVERMDVVIKRCSDYKLSEEYKSAKMSLAT